MLEMIGIGPFITIGVITSAMGGPQAVLGWFLGAVFSVCDGMVYAELGAAMPGAGGAFIYFREAFNAADLGVSVFVPFSVGNHFRRPVGNLRPLLSVSRNIAITCFLAWPMPASAPSLQLFAPSSPSSFIDPLNP